MRGMLHGREACTLMSLNHFRDSHKAASLVMVPTSLLTTKRKNTSFSHSYPYPNSPPPFFNVSVAAASSSSASFPVPADIPSPTEADKSLDPKKQKKNRIAGVDQDDLLDPTFLADPDSYFCEFKGVQIHHKLYQPHHAHQPIPTSSSSQALHPSPKLGFPIILLHGFGASLFSWSRVMKPLAHLTNSKVLAFDRPAFGLTSRPHLSAPVAQDTVPLNPYSMAFSVLATLYFIDSLAADKAVLVGHSAGSLVAVNTYFEAPERVAALILIAPAILAPIAFQKFSEGVNMGMDRETKRETSNTNMLGKSFVKLLMILAKSAAYIAQAIMLVVKGMLNMVNSLYKKALSAILRSALGAMLIRVVIDKFGVAAVRNAWYDANKVSEDVLAGYTKPLRAKGWDKALAEFTAATLASTESEAKPYFAERLSEISCPVLIITGDSDRLVPSWNAWRLSQAIPGSSIEEIKHCGHLPHEEKVEEFLSAVEKFLRKAFSDSEELSVQSAI